MARVAQRESLTPEKIRQEVAAGRMVIPANRLHLAGDDGVSWTLRHRPGRRHQGQRQHRRSPLGSCMDQELVKLQVGRQVRRRRRDGPVHRRRPGRHPRHLIANSAVPIGTVPIYSMIVGKAVEDLTRDDILSAIASQARQGVDFFTIHAGILRRHLPLVGGRKTGDRLPRRQPAGQVDGPSRPREPDVRDCSTRSARSCAR